MGQPPAQGSGVDVDGTRRAALPIAVYPRGPLSVLLLEGSKDPWVLSPHPLLEYVPWALQSCSGQGENIPLGPVRTLPIWKYPMCAGGALTGEAV